MEDSKPGYHITIIEKGKLGEISKIQEELDEMKDAEKQGCKIMLAVEMADLYGALKVYAELNGFSMEDLKTMSEITERAFKNGRR